MRGKDFNTGLRGVLFEAQHYERMGAAIWLYGWLVLRQTHQSGGIGYVLGGAPVSYREIEEETGFNPRTLERWMRALRNQGYIETESTAGGVTIRICKAKKFRRFPQFPQPVESGLRKNAEHPHKFAGGSPQNCVAEERDCFSVQRDAEAMGSSSVARSDKETEPHVTNLQEGKSKRPSHEVGVARAPSAGRYEEALLTPRELLELTRAQLQLLRAERDDAVKRELRVGANPARGA